MRAEAWRQRILIIIIKRPAGDKIRTAYEQTSERGSKKEEERYQLTQAEIVANVSNNFCIFAHIFLCSFPLSFLLLQCVACLLYVIYCIIFVFGCVFAEAAERERESRARSMIRGRRGCQLTAISARSSHEADRRRPPA